MLSALRAPIWGFSSASMMRDVPICNSAWPTRPLGPSMRSISVAPKTFL